MTNLGTFKQLYVVITLILFYLFCIALVPMVYGARQPAFNVNRTTTESTTPPQPAPYDTPTGIPNDDTVANNAEVPTGTTGGVDGANPDPQPAPALTQTSSPQPSNAVTTRRLITGGTPGTADTNTPVVVGPAEPVSTPEVVNDQEQNNEETGLLFSNKPGSPLLASAKPNLWTTLLKFASGLGILAAIGWLIAWLLTRVNRLPQDSVLLKVVPPLTLISPGRLVTESPLKTGWPATDEPAPPELDYSGYYVDEVTTPFLPVHEERTFNAQH